MRAPIGIKISNRRKSLKLSQAELARLAGISPSYMNLIERNRRDVGGSLLHRIADHLDIGIDQLTGEAEHKLLQDLDEAFSDPLLDGVDFAPDEARELVAQHPGGALALARLHRAYGEANANADAYANRLRADPLFSQLLHQILSGITAVRSGAEILEDVPDLDDSERRRFLASITHEARRLTEVAQNLIGQFDRTSQVRRAVSPRRQLDDLIIADANYFPSLEAVAARLLAEIETFGPLSEEALVQALGARFGIAVRRGTGQEVDSFGFPGQYHFDADLRTMWFQASATAATRRFQLMRLYGELAAGDVLDAATDRPELTSPDARRLALRALGSYLAGAMVFPYDRFLADAEACGYDIDHLCQLYTASFEQVAHRFVTLRRPDRSGVPFGFLRSDPAGRLTKHFPLPGLLLPNSGHACPLWAIYGAFRQPDALVRQVVRFTDGSRYLFIARTVSKRHARFGDVSVPSSVMLACDVLHADALVYGRGLDLDDLEADVPVGPACRLCTRRDCPSRQEEAPAPGGGQAAIRAPLVVREGLDSGER